VSGTPHLSPEALAAIESTRAVRESRQREVIAAASAQVALWRRLAVDREHGRVSADEACRQLGAAAQRLASAVDAWEAGR